MYIIVYYLVYHYILLYTTATSATIQDCEDNVNRKEPEISHVLNVQLKLQSGPRLVEFNQMKSEFTVMWEDFNDKVQYISIWRCYLLLQL